MGERDSREEILKGAPWAAMQRWLALLPRPFHRRLDAASRIPALTPAPSRLARAAFRLFDDEGKVRAPMRHARSVLCGTLTRGRPTGHHHVQEPEARGQGARREHDGRGAAGDDRRGGPRRRRRSQRGGAPLLRRCALRLRGLTPARARLQEFIRIMRKTALVRLPVGLWRASPPLPSDVPTALFLSAVLGDSHLRPRLLGRRRCVPAAHARTHARRTGRGCDTPTRTTSPRASRLAPLRRAPAEHACCRHVARLADTCIAPRA